MQIPANLIEEIENGRSVYRCLPMGGSGAMSLPCPENKYLVIFGFTYNHFMNESDPGSNIGTAPRTIIKHVQFQSRDGRYIYNFRTLLTRLNYGTDGAPVTKFVPSNGAETIPVYQIHTADVNISVWNFPQLKLGTFDFANVPAHQGTIENPRLGYGMGGVGLSVVKNIVPLLADNSWVINPQNKNNLPSPGARFEFVSQIVSVNALPRPQKDELDNGLTQFPLINVYYVIRNKSVSSKKRH